MRRRPSNSVGDLSTEHELKRLQEEVVALTASLQSAKDLIRAAPAFFGYLSLQGRVIDLNDLAVQVIGKNRHEVIGQIFWMANWWSPIPESARRVQEAFALALQRQASHFELQYWAKLPDHDSGEVRWVSLRIMPELNEKNEVFRIVASGIDITEQMRARTAEADLIFERNQLETIFQQSPAAMVLWAGSDFIFEKVNPRYQAIFPDRILKGRAFLEACPEFKDQPFQHLLTQVLETGEPFIGREILARHATFVGGPIEDHYYDFTYMRVNDAEGKPYGVYDHAIDVTDRVLARKELEEAIKIRDDLLSICSHELRTPVASMKLSTQMFRRGLEKNDPKMTSMERVKRMVEQSDRQLDRLTRLIEEMLDFSRISGGRLKINPDEFDLVVLVSEALERIRPQFEVAAVTVSFEEGTPVKGQWDRFRLEQVITNLLSNALKYGAGKPVHINLTQTKESAILSVHDQGMGISVADQIRIFKPYERAVSVTNISGLGLGLYIAHQIILAHDGKIEVKSEPGKGAVFTITLPKSFKVTKEKERTP